MFFVIIKSAMFWKDDSAAYSPCPSNIYDRSLEVEVVDEVSASKKSLPTIASEAEDKQADDAMKCFTVG